MSERTKLIKKAVMTGVGASSNVDRIKSALNEAMEDLMKVGQDLLSDLESKGKDKTDNAQHFLENLRQEATKRTKDVSKQAQTLSKKAVKEIGLVTRQEFDELSERLCALEEALTGCEEDAEGKKSRSRSKKAHSN